MKNNLFFPYLTRQELSQYHNRNGTFYADYTSNYERIAQDCLKRCVYCDATERECGGDNFSLDHFRPRKVFAEKFNGVLVTHPYNLYLACQKCNILKSSEWYGCIDTSDGFSYLNNRGFIDRFKHKSEDYFLVNNNGEIVCSNPLGPTNYMIKKLYLNRPNRIFLRKKRIIKSRINKIKETIDLLSKSIMNDFEMKLISSEFALERINKIRTIQNALLSL